MHAQYIDIHTHHTRPSAEGFAIQSTYNNFDQTGKGITCSMGLHPRYLDNYALQLNELVNHAPHPNVLAIGECGLDRLCDTDWELQLAAFTQQIQLANRLQKPLIIHCVRAFDELLQTFARQKPLVPVIIHGYNKKDSIARKLLANGYYLSFGAALLHDSNPAIAILKNIPGAQFFLETDDAEVQIADIYANAAAIRETTVEAIILQVQQNFKNVFNL